MSKTLNFVLWMSMLQMIMLEGAKATTETVDALRTGAAAMKAMQKATYVPILSVKHINGIFTHGLLIVFGGNIFTFLVAAPKS
jgi:2-keto-3-deoxy-6-phosphogluconate aldolase